uniref:Uncharacterized protein n=1 Tax=Denticeps clupeoides TaxID=299321 RepID=A0AAY4BVM1_9TELE
QQGLLTSPRHYKAPKDLEQTSAPGSPPAGEGTLCRVRLSPQWFSEPCEGEDTDLWDQEGDHGEGPLPRRKQEILHKNHRKASGEGTCSRPSKVQSGNVKRRKNGKIAEVNRSQKTSSLPVAEVPVDAQARQPNINKKAEPETLPVTCGPARGVLHKSRFASGTIGKCIRTERSWFTPEDFLREDVNLVNGLWRRDILSDGKPLSELLEKEILVIHSVLCECFVCKGNPKDQGNDDVCFICGQDTELVCCDKCPRTFHYACHLPTLEESSLGDKWLCTFCLVEKVAQLQSPMTRQQVLDSPISTYKLVRHAVTSATLCSSSRPRL